MKMLLWKRSTGPGQAGQGSHLLGNMYQHEGAICVGCKSPPREAKLLVLLELLVQHRLCLPILFVLLFPQPYVCECERQKREKESGYRECGYEMCGGCLYMNISGAVYNS